MPAIYDNNTGLATSLDEALYTGLTALLAPLIKSQDGSDDIVTGVGPVFVSVQPVLWNFERLLSAREAGYLDRMEIANLLPAGTPSLGIHLFGFDNVNTQRRHQLDIDYPIHLYFSSSGPGVIEQPESTSNTTHDPGLSILKELLLDHLLSQNISTSIGSFRIKHLDRVKLLGPVGSSWWAELQLVVNVKYVPCIVDTAALIDGMRIPHETPEGANAPINTQGEDYP